MPDSLLRGRKTVRELEEAVESLRKDWEQTKDPPGTQVSPEKQIATLTNEARTTNQQMHELLKNPVLDQDTVQQARDASKQATDLVERIQRSGLVATITPLEERRQTLDSRITTLEDNIQRRDSHRWGRLASSVLGPKSSDAKALRQSLAPITDEIRGFSTLLRVSSDLETNQRALQGRMREERDFAQISSVETKSEQQPIPSESATRRGRSSRRLSDNLVLLVQRASELKAWLDEEAALAARPEQSGQQQRPLGTIAEDDVGGRLPSPRPSEQEPSTPIEEMGFVKPWAGPSIGSPEGLLAALTQDVSEAAQNSQPWLESIQKAIDDPRAIPKETIDQLQKHLGIFETLHKRSKELANNPELTDQQQEAARSLEPELSKQIEELRIAISIDEDLEIGPSAGRSHTTASKSQQLLGTDSPLPAAQTKQLLQRQPPSTGSGIHL